MSLKSLPPVLMRSANRLDKEDPWLVLLEVTFSPEEILRLVNNTDDIEFEGHVYYAFEFNITLPKESSKGEIPSVTLSVSNVTRLIQRYVEQYEGAVGKTVKITVVDAGHLDENYAELTMTLTVQSAKCTPKYVAFTLGSINPINKRFPPDLCLAKNCRFNFKDVRCGYKGAATSCERSLAACKALNNTARFGGHPGLSGKGLRLV